MTTRRPGGNSKNSGYKPERGQPEIARDYRPFRPINDMRVSEAIADLGALDRVDPDIWKSFAARYVKEGTSRYELLLEALVAAHDLADTHYFKQISPTRTVAHHKLKRLAEVTRSLMEGLMPEEAFPPLRGRPGSGNAVPQAVRELLPHRRIDPSQRGAIFGFLDQDIVASLEAEASRSPFTSDGAPAIDLHDALRHLTALNHWLAWAAYRTPSLSPQERGAQKELQVSVFMRELDSSVRTMRWIGEGSTQYSHNSGKPAGWRYDFLRAAEAYGFEQGLLVGQPVRAGTTELISDSGVRKILTSAQTRKSKP